MASNSEDTGFWHRKLIHHEVEVLLSKLNGSSPGPLRNPPVSVLSSPTSKQQLVSLPRLKQKKRMFRGRISITAQALTTEETITQKSSRTRPRRRERGFLFSLNQTSVTTIIVIPRVRLDGVIAGSQVPHANPEVGRCLITKPATWQRPN